MERFNHNLSHALFVAGDLGRLQTLCRIPVIAGDSISLSLTGNARLGQLRREMVLNCEIVIAAFYVPHRHVYGDDWITLVRSGYDEAVTLTSGPVYGDQRYMKLNLTGTPTLPLWITGGYNSIWNFFWRAPTDDANIKALNALETAFSRGGNFGSVIGRIGDKPWASGVEGEATDTEREVTVVANQLDIVDIQEAQARLTSEQRRAFYGTRYNNSLQRTWGGSAHPDADQRPTMLWKTVGTLAGYDIDATGDTSVGTYSGKGVSKIRFNMPFKYMPEHGALWVLMAVRPPTVYAFEKHFLDDLVNPTYQQFLGDPDFIRAAPPIPVSADDYFSGGATNDLGSHPSFQYMRYEPDHVNPLYRGVSGFPFPTTTPVSADEVRYHTNAEYDGMFSSQVLGQWRLDGEAFVHARRVIPPSSTSIFAGSDLG